jgi:hypothetical protein
VKKLLLIACLIANFALFATNLTFDSVPDGYDPTWEENGITWVSETSVVGDNGTYCAMGMALSWGGGSHLRPNDMTLDFHTVEVKSYSAAATISIYAYSNDTITDTVTFDVPADGFHLVDLNFENATSIRFSSGFWFDNLYYGVTGSNGDVTGTVVDDSNNPLEGATITIGSATATTDASGTYSFTGISSGLEDITCTKASHIPYSGEIYVRSDEEVSYDMELVFSAGGFSIADDFETGNLSENPWYNSVDNPWVVDNSESHGGTYSVKSNIESNQTSELCLDVLLLEAGNLTFWHKESTDTNDNLAVFIDDVEVGTFSGENDWVEASLAITSGAHTVKFQYARAGDTGSNSVWIDDIQFPESAEYATVSGNITNLANAPVENAELKLYNGGLVITSSADGSYQIPELTAGTYNYTLTKESHFDATGSFTVTANEDLNLNLSIEEFTTATFTGVVKDIVSGSPIEGAKVSLSGAHQFEVLTDASGNFTISDIFAGDYYASIYASGYRGNYETRTLNGNVDLGNVELTELLYPVSNINAQMEGNNANVSWEIPGSTAPHYFKYDSGLTEWGSGSGNIGSIPNHLFGNAYYSSAIVNQVEFQIFDYNTSGPHEDAARIIILGLGEDGYPDPARVLYESDWLSVMNGHDVWNTYELPQAIEAPNGFFVGIRGNNEVEIDLFLCTELPKPWSSQEYGNSMLCADITTDDASWYCLPLSDGSGYRTFQVRATGFNIETLDNRPEEPTERSSADFCDVTGDRFNRNNDSIANFGSSFPTSSRSVASYDIFRLNADDIDDETAWTEISTGVSELNFIDTDISNQTAGVYRYAVKTNYSGNLTSCFNTSNLMPYDMTSTLNLTINNANQTATTNAHVRLVGEDDYSIILNLDSYDEVLTNENTISIDVYKQVYTLYVDLEGYEQHVQTDVYLFGDTDLTVNLTDKLVTPFDVKLESDPATGVNVSWLAAKEEIIYNQYGEWEGRSVRAIDIPSEHDWAEFDSEVVFDFVVTDPMVVTKMNIFAQLYHKPGYNGDKYWYPYAASFSVKLYANENGLPGETCIDSTATLPDSANAFHEFEGVLEEPFYLEPGTYWIGASVILPPQPAWPEYPDGLSLTVNIPLATSAQNNTGSYWRMPYDGYNLGYDEWYDLQTDVRASVIGRNLTNPVREVMHYDVYRLLADDMDDQDEWTLLADDTTELNFLDTTVPESDIYRYAIVATFANGESEPAFSAEEMIDPVDNEEDVNPLTTELYGNYPNPFNPTTAISFSLKETSNVQLVIYNVKGQVVKTLVNDELEKGNHTIVWSGKDNSDKATSSGVYFYKLKAQNYSSIKKMLLLK